MANNPIIKITGDGVTVEGEVTSSTLFAIIQRMAEKRSQKDARFPNTPATEHCLISSILKDCMDYLAEEIYEAGQVTAPESTEGQSK
jgi:hypothetical protein